MIQPNSSPALNVEGSSICSGKKAPNGRVANGGVEIMLAYKGREIHVY